MGRASAFPAQREARRPWARIHVSEVFLERKTSPRNSSRSRQIAAHRRLFQAGVDRGRRGVGGGSRPYAWSLFTAGRGIEGVSFHAGTGGGSLRSGLLAVGN